MSITKYRKGKLIRNMEELARYDGAFFKVCFGYNHYKTIHRGFLLSWQYRTLEHYVKAGKVSAAELIT